MTGGAFQTQTVIVNAGCSRGHDEADWRGALVVVKRGEIELECLDGARKRFSEGSLIWLTGLRLRLIRNRGTQPAVLVAISRRSSR